MAMVIRVRFKRAAKLYDFDPNGLELHNGMSVVTETARGVELGECMSGVMDVPDERLVLPLKPIIRIATEQDLAMQKRNEQAEKEAFDIAIDRIAEHKLEMKLVDVEYAFDRSKIIFYFTANGRVDFRMLVKSLASIFKTRIELRQIGVRDEAKMLGGLGPCGRPICCGTFLGDFQPVSIKMAKEQNLSLNPTKISGLCGRLMCCLKYEQDTYESLIRTSPKPESFVDTPEGRGTVVEADILRQRVKVQMESSPDTVSVFPNEEIAILRNGKAKKNDPPIPADLAPISGSGKRVRKQPEEAPLLEPIRFRYRSESLVEEQPAPEQPVQEEQPERQERGGRSRQRRQRGEAPQPPQSASEQGEERRPRRERGRRLRPENQEQRMDAPQAEAPQKEAKDRPDAQRQGSRRSRPPRKQGAQPGAQQSAQPSAPQNAPEGTPDGEARKPRRNNYRRRKPKAPQGGES